ncbi:MAG: translation elongation factor Ts [Desulfovibrio sp.]|jgi:elongation factor Ts|nr:translation elongation factor Ts [Desulfovibrio sp.]
MTITAQTVKALREKTGAGMMDCKKALVEAGGDMEKAVDWLRQKGVAKAAKKSGRATSEGIVALAADADGKNTALAALLCETDFVARSDQFRAAADGAAQTVLDKNPAGGDVLKALMGDELARLIAAVGENVQLGKFARYSLKGDNELVGSYVHSNRKIGVLVHLALGKAANADRTEIREMAKNLAMQVAAANPMSLDAASLDQAAVAREREIYRRKALEEGKPEAIVDKIADGAVKKFRKEVCLLEQPYIRDDKKSVGDVVGEVARAVNDTITVTGFARVQLAAE